MSLKLLALITLAFFSSGCSTDSVLTGSSRIIAATTTANQLGTIEAGSKASNLYSSEIKPSIYGEITSPRKLTKSQQEMHDRQELMMRLQENKNLGNDAPKDPYGIERLCKSNPNNDTCKMFNLVKKTREAELNYQHLTHDASNKELAEKINTAISSKKLQSEHKHIKYENRIIESPDLSKKWNSVVNKVVTSEANGNIYRTVIENKEDLARLNHFLTNNKATVQRKGGIYSVSLPDKGLENRINRMIKPENGREIISVAFSMKRLNKIHNIAVSMSKKGYLRNAPLVASIYSKYPKNLYVITGKKESPKTTNVYGNLYIHKDHLAELNKYGMLNFVLHHEAMHIKDNLLGFDILRRSTELFERTKNLWVQGAFVTGDDKNAKRLRDEDMKWAEAYFKHLVGSDMKGHSEALRELVYKEKIKPRDLSEGVMAYDLLREINIDMDVSKYVSSSEAYNYIQSMINKVSFNNRYRMMLKNSSGLEKADFENMYITDKKYTNYKQLFMDKSISDDAYHFNILGVM